MNMLKTALAAGLLFGFTTSAQAEDLLFVLSNNSSANITGLQISTTSTNSWEENLMSGDVLRPQEETEITIADGEDVCEYDILITFADNTTIEDRNVNLCELGSYEAHD